MLKRPTSKQPAPKHSMKSPNARTNFISTIDTPVPKLSYSMKDSGPSVEESRESAISDDFASPIVVRRETPQHEEEKEVAEDQKEQHQGVVNEKDDCEPTKEDGSTIAKYVERFRSTQPRSRGERARSGLQAQPTDFWWTSAEDKKPSKMKVEVGVAYKSPFKKKAPVDKNRHQSLIPRMTRTPQKEDYVEEDSSELPAVSTDGLDSNLSSNDTGVLRPLNLSGFASPLPASDEEMEEDVTFRPQFIASPLRYRSSSPPIRLQEDDGGDILARWRVKNQMELAREKTKPIEPPTRHHFRRTDAVPNQSELCGLPQPPREPPQPSYVPPQPPHMPPQLPHVPPQPLHVPPQPLHVPPQVLPTTQSVGIQISPPPQDAEVQTSDFRFHCDKKERRKRKKRKERKEEKSVLTQVVARGLGFGDELQDSVNSIFGPDVSLRASSDKNLASTVREAETSAKSASERCISQIGVSQSSLKLSSDFEITDASQEREAQRPKSPTIEELVSRHDEKSEIFMHDVIVRQLRYQLLSKMEQIRLIDEELRARGHHI